MFTVFTFILMAFGAGLFYLFFLAPNTTTTPEKKTNKPAVVKKQTSNTQTKKEMSASDPNLILVNKTHKLSSSYVPSDLRIPDVRFISYADPKVKQMKSNAASALEGLFQSAASNNITLLAVSGYRPYDYQQDVYSAKVKKDGKQEADKYVAVPGSSEHQTGLAMDLLSTEYSGLDDGFKNTKAYAWLNQNCANYGFIIRYPADKTDITKYDFEPWHLRYVGVTAAKEIMQKHITLEEYLGDTN